MSFMKGITRTLGKYFKYGLFACAMGWMGSASAAYPDKPITLIVAYPPGGTVDLVARVMEPELSRILGQPVVVVNKGGAGGMIGDAYVARSKPDGYTVLLDASSFAQNPALRSKMSFDAIKDFAPVSLLLKVPNVLVTTPSSDIKSVDDLIQAGKDKSRSMYFASSGQGSAQHLAGELFNMLAGTQLTHVAYKGGGAAMTDVMGGQVPIMFASLGSSWAHIDKGMLRPVAVGGTQRSSLMPDVPTIAESGIPGFSSYDWDAIFVPAGTPAPIVDKLSAAFAQALSAPKVQTTLKGIGADIIGSTPAELEKFLHEEISKWKDVAKKANLKLD